MGSTCLGDLKPPPYPQRLLWPPATMPASHLILTLHEASRPLLKGNPMFRSPHCFVFYVLSPQGPVRAWRSFHSNKPHS